MKNLKPLSKRAYTFIAVFFIILIAVSLLASCSSDDPVSGNNNNPPTETEILKIDSITVSSGTRNGIDTTFNFLNTDIDSLKIVFTAETNTSQSMNPLIAINIEDSIDAFFSVGCQQLSEFHDYTLYTATRNINYKATLQLSISPMAFTTEYVKIKNFHIFKVR